MNPAPEHDHTVTLRLCKGMAANGGIVLAMNEMITPRWSAVGDSLRRDLADTLHLRFGAWVAER
jgi:hypothetical protein